MDVAIIGGGAAGMVTAHLLGRAHAVTVFERDDVLGGHVRTLASDGGNVTGASLPPGVHLDVGVIEFDRLHFPRFHALMDELGVQMAEVPATSGLFLADGSAWHAPERLRREYPARLQRSLKIPRHLPLLAARLRFLARVADVSPAELARLSVDDFLDDDAFGTWLRMLLMYAYSIPYPRVGAIGAVLAIPMLRRFVHTSEWTRVVGGVWTYLRRICDGFGGEIAVGCEVTRITRGPGGITVTAAGGPSRRFDAVVIATPPDRVLPLLADADDDEKRRFAAWKPNEAVTLLHSDGGLYTRRHIAYRSEFDLFETKNGGHGYNAYLNRLCGLDESRPPHYGLAFGLSDEIDPARVVHEQHYATPGYTVEALSHRDEVLAANGRNDTWYVGAWLGDGLHEGAVVSAERVALALGGRAIGSPLPGSPPSPATTPPAPDRR